MTSNIEEGILAFLSAELGAVEVTYGTKDNAITVLAATLEGVKVGLYAVTADNAVAESWAGIVIKASEAKVDVAPLWSSILEINVSTPRNSTDYTPATHRAILSAVRALIVPANQEAIALALAEFDIASCNGWFAAGEPDQHTTGRWMTTLQFDPFAFTV
jgi:hypothetical protein